MRMSTTKGDSLRWALGLLIVLFTLTIQSAAKEKDPERKVLYRLEYIDIEKVLENQRMLTNFIRCFMRQGPCTPEARDFRKLLPKLAISMCADCSSRQRYIIKKVFGHLMEHRPKEWQQLLDRFDPQRKYAERLHIFMGDGPSTAEYPPELLSLPVPVPVSEEPKIPSKSKLLKKVESFSKSENINRADIYNNNNAINNTSTTDKPVSS